MKKGRYGYRYYLFVKSALFFFALLTAFSVDAQSLQVNADAKINQLKALVKKAESLKLDATREKMTLNTAGIFLKFADWDEQHINDNLPHFKRVGMFKDSALQMTTGLANFERSEVVSMLEKSIRTLNDVIGGKINRKPAFQVDWAKVTLDKDQLTYKGRPVFLHDYTWKPDTKELNEYLGNQDGFFLSPAFVVNEAGEINAKVQKPPDGRVRIYP